MTNKSSSTPETPRKQNKKQFSLTAISKEAKDINTLKEHVWDAESNTVIRYYERFDSNKIEALLNELYEDIAYCADKEIDFFQDDSNFMKYASLLLIKTFTHLSKTIPNEFEKKVGYMKEMLAIGLVEEIFDKCFLDEEVFRVFEKITETAALNEKMAIELESQNTKLENFLSNSENIKQLQKLNAHKDVIHPLVDPTVLKKMNENGNV